MLTRITRISKESFFSDMNNLRVCSMTSPEYDYAFRFTEKEVYYMLLEFIKGWFSTSNNGYSDFITAMLSNDVEYMNVYLSRICSHIFSYYDTSGNEPERFYHGFVLGMLVDLEDRFIITSNRESGLGRYDIILEPRNCENNPAIIMEFKVHRPRTEADLISTAQNALQQIEEKDYVAQLISNGILPHNIFKYVIAFKGKEVWIEK